MNEILNEKGLVNGLDIYMATYRVFGEYITIN